MAKRILVLVDIQPAFISESDPLVKKLVKLLQSGRFDTVIGTEYSGNANSLFERFVGWTYPNNGGIFPCLLSYIDKVIQKSVYCDINALTDALKKHNCGTLPEQVYIAGADTDACVLMTAMELFNSGVRPIVLSEYCCSSGGKEYHEMGLKMLQRNIGENNVI